eukprot:scaffold223968_cov28-Tisochrysis_lutea.AAC.1
MAPPPSPPRQPQAPGAGNRQSPVPCRAQSNRTEPTSGSVACAPETHHSNKDSPWWGQHCCHPH